MQHFETHGAATIKVGPSYSVVPSEEWGEKTPIIAVRKYEVSAAIIHLAYYYYYGSHRCNLALDGYLGEAVFVDTILSNLDYTQENERRTVIGLVSGYLHKCENNKGRISLDSRSCKLLAFFAPFDTAIKLPFTLGEEDKLSMRINPFDLGAPIKWYRELCNMQGVTYEKIHRINRYPSAWNDNELPEDFIFVIK